MRTKLKVMVNDVLRDNPETRNSDITLMIEIRKRYYPQRIIEGQRGDGIHLRSLYDLPREDNIKRVRALFNSKGEYLPTDKKVAIARGINEDVWRKALGYPLKKYTVHPTKRPSQLFDTRV